MLNCQEKINYKSIHRFAKFANGDFLLPRIQSLLAEKHLNDWCGDFFYFIDFNKVEVPQ
jgi:hypothetical protein